jgi:hypothetical protein
MASTEQIAKSLLELEHCPSDSMRQMLLKGLPHAFGGERHAYQLEYAKLLRKCLEQESNHQLQAQEKCAGEVTDINTQLEAGQAEAAAAAECVQAARTVVEEKASALSLKQEAAKAEAGRHSQTEAAKEAAVSDFQKQEQLKAEVDSVANVYLQTLINGGWEDNEACQEFVSVVHEYLTGMNCESPLLAALPKALGRRPDDRGMFDKIVLEEVVAVINAKVASVTSMVEQEKEKVEDSNATDLGAWAIWDLARDLEKAAGDAHDQAKQELKGKIAEQKTMDTKVSQTNSLLRKTTSSKAIIDLQVQEIELSLGELARLETQKDEEVSAEVPEPSPKKRKIDVADTEIEVQAVAVGA